MSQPARYHGFLIALHWLLAVTLAISLVMGSTQLVNTPNASPEKIDALRAHMMVGITILILMIVRLVVRIKTAKPAPASTGVALLDKAGVLTHILLYLLVFAMIGSGIALAIQANLFAAVFKASVALPSDFNQYPPRLVHGLIAKALMGLAGLHVMAALYHQLVRRDNLLSRMWWKK